VGIFPLDFCATDCTVNADINYNTKQNIATQTKILNMHKFGLNSVKTEIINTILSKCTEHVNNVVCRDVTDSESESDIFLNPSDI